MSGSPERAVHVVAAWSLADLAARLDALGPGDGDLVLAHPAEGALVAGEAADVAAAHAPFGDGIAVAAGADPAPGGAGPAGRALAEALDRQLGALPHRVHPHPPALCGPAGALRALLASLPPGDGDAERLAAAFLDGPHDLALDSGGQVFRVLDGTGTDVIAVAGRLHAGEERPVAAVDPAGGAGLGPLAAALADPGGDDLAAVLRYDGAAAPPGPAEAVAADIVSLPFWTPAFCATVIRAAEAAGVWASDPDDPVPGAEVPLHALSPRLMAHVDDHVRRDVWPALHRYWPEAAATPVHDAFVIRYEAGGPADLPLHHDVAQVSASVRLNDGYAGGALTFPRQGWDNAGVPVGRMVAWPSLVTHPHRAEPVERGVKYGLTVWLALPG